MTSKAAEMIFYKCMKTHHTLSTAIIKHSSLNLCLDGFLEILLLVNEGDHKVLEASSVNLRYVTAPEHLLHF